MGRWTRSVCWSATRWTTGALRAWAKHVTASLHHSLTPRRAASLRPNPRMGSYAPNVRALDESTVAGRVRIQAITYSSSLRHVQRRERMFSPLTRNLSATPHATPDHIPSTTPLTCLEISATSLLPTPSPTHGHHLFLRCSVVAPRISRPEGCTGSSRAITGRTLPPHIAHSAELSCGRFIRITNIQSGYQCCESTCWCRLTLSHLHCPMTTQESERSGLLPTTTLPSQGVYNAVPLEKPPSFATLPLARQKTMCTCDCDCACERGVPIITSIHLHTPRHQHSLSPSSALALADTSTSLPIAVLLTFMTLFMSVVGAGMLSIPFTFASAPVSVVLMSLLGVGLAMGYTAELLVRVHIATNVSTFNGLAEVAFGPVVAKVVSATTIFAILGACVGCIEIVTDLSPFLVQLMGIDTSYNPSSVVLPLFIAAIYPLTLLKKITALRFSSYVGFVASIYLVVAVTSRASSTPAPIADPVLPALDNLPLKVAHIVSVFNYAFVSHLNVIPLYANLHHAMQPSLLPSFDGTKHALSALSLMRVVIYAMSLFCIAMYAVFGTHALALYGAHVQGNILLNLENDRVMEFPRLAVLVTILFSFPLLFHPFMMLVESFVLLLAGCEDVHVSRPVKAVESLVLLLVVVAVATVMPGIQVTFSLTGASCVTLICYVFPVLAYLRLCPADSMLRRGAAVVVGLFGVATGVAATGLVLTGTTV